MRTRKPARRPTGERPGPKSRYGVKRRQPTAVVLTEQGQTALVEGAKNNGMSRSDYVETLLRGATAWTST